MTNIYSKQHTIQWNDVILADQAYPLLQFLPKKKICQTLPIKLSHFISGTNMVFWLLKYLSNMSVYDIYSQLQSFMS